MARLTSFGGWTLCSCGVIAQDHNTDNPNGATYLADYPGLGATCEGYDGVCVPLQPVVAKFLSNPMKGSMLAEVEENKAIPVGLTGAR